MRISQLLTENDSQTVKILRVEFYRGQIEKMDVEERQVSGKLLSFARQLYKEDKSDAASWEKEFFNPPTTGKFGAISYTTGEYTEVYVLPESHPAYHMNFADAENWSDKAVQDFQDAVEN
jgi:hypothetical protein